MYAVIEVRTEDGAIVSKSVVQRIETGMGFVLDLPTHQAIIEGDWLFKGFAFQSVGLEIPPTR